jgi:hypothetical protein
VVAVRLFGLVLIVFGLGGGAVLVNYYLPENRLRRRLAAQRAEEEAALESARKRAEENELLDRILDPPKEEGK